MACGKNVGCKALLCLGLFVVASSLCRCNTLTRLKALDKLRENSTHSHGQAKGSGPHNGRLFIGQSSQQETERKGAKATKNLLDDDDDADDTDYQADMGWPKQPRGQGSLGLVPNDAAVEQLLKMEPKVECTGDSMRLKVQDTTSTPGSLFFVDRGSHLSPLPLSKLPPSCGYTIGSTQRDSVLVAPYDGCFVALEEDCYVLPLRWCGVPVRMSCPLTKPSSPNPPMVTCHARGMVVKTEWTVPVAKIKVNLTGNWEPLMKASPRCGFSVVVHPEGVVISVHYAPCLEKKNGMYTLELAGDGQTKISCPSLSAPQPEPTESPEKGPKQQTKIPTKWVHPHSPSQNSHDQSPQSAAPQVPGFPQNPVLPNEKPIKGPKDINQPQFPYYPFYPNFLYPYTDPNPAPTVQPLPSSVTKKNGLQSQQTVSPSHLPVAPEEKVPQPFLPFPFYPLPGNPGKESPVQSQANQPPNGRAENPLYPYPYYVRLPNNDVHPAQRPELKPIPTMLSPVIQSTKSQRQQPYYPFPFYPQPPKHETSPAQPLMTSPPPGKLDEHVLPNPFNPSSSQSQRPTQPPARQPEGQEHKPFFPFPFHPRPPALEHPRVEQPLPEKTLPTESPVPQKQMYQQYYQNLFYPPFWPQDPYQMHMPFKPPTPTLAPEGQVQQPLSPFPPEASKPQVTGNFSPSKEPSQPKAPQGQVHEYPYPQPTPIQPPQPEAPWGQVHQLFYPHLIYPQPEPKNQPAETEVQKPSYPQPSKIPGAGTNGVKTLTEKPGPSVQPPEIKPPEGQVYYPYNLYYSLQPQQSQPKTLPPAISVQKQQVPIMQPSNSGIVPQGPQPDYPHIPPLYCPQSCPSGLNCCPQIAFYQHLHIVPAERGSKDAPSVYPALPFHPSVTYSGFGNGPAPLLQEPPDATMQASRISPISPQSPSPGNEKQPYLLPADGNPAMLTSIARKPINPELPTYPYFVPNSQFPNWPYLPQNEGLQNLFQSQSTADHNFPSKPHAQGDDPVNPRAQYESYYIQPPEQRIGHLSPEHVNNPSGLNFRSYLGMEHKTKQQNEPTSEKQQLPNKPTETKGLMHPKVQSEPDPFLVPYYMLQDAQAPTHNASEPQLFLGSSMRLTKHEPTVHPHSEPKNYVLLQHGPPGRGPNSFNDSQLPFKELVHDTNVLAQNLVRHHSQPQHPKGLEKMSSPSTDSVNYMQELGDKSESLPLFALTPDGPHFGHLPKDPSSAAHLKPEFPESLKDIWKPSRPLGSNGRTQAHVPGKAFKLRSSAADQ